MAVWGCPQRAAPINFFIARIPVHAPSPPATSSVKPPSVSGLSVVRFPPECMPAGNFRTRIAMLSAEQVLVIPTHRLFSTFRSPFQGFLQGGIAELFSIVAQHGFFASRDSAEGDPELKQIIPYGMLVWSRQVFLMKRSRKGGEARLHDRVSLGVGGHVNPIDSLDGDLVGAIGAAFERELNEELAVETTYHGEDLGLLNDDSNPVGKEQLGIVFR